MRQESILSFDQTPLNCYIWDEVPSPVGLVIIAHDFFEHAGRYDTLAQYLNERGYVVFAHDQRAHGLTSTVRGYDRGDIFRNSVRDLVFLDDMLYRRYGLPQQIIGMGYGSFLIQALLQEDVHLLGVTLVGVSRITISGSLPLQLVYLLPRLFAPKARSHALVRALRRSAKRKLKSKPDPAAWRTSQPDQQSAFDNDPLCFDQMSMAFIYYLMRGIFLTNLYPDKLHPNLPIAVFGGKDDVIGRSGKGADRLIQYYTKHGVYYVESKFYDNARHDILHDTVSDQVMQDIYDYIKRVSDNDLTGRR